MKLKSLTRLILLCGLALPAQAFAQQEQPQLYLAWHAPRGDPGASDTLIVACGDTARIDTLYLSFQVPKPTPGVLSMKGILYFHPQKGDTLGPFWRFKRGWANESNLRIDFDKFMGFPCELPWRIVGYGQVDYDHRSGRGRLDLDFEIHDKHLLSGLIPDTRYCFARVMIRHRRCALAGFDQPVAAEFATAQIKFATGRVLEIAGGEQRVVTWNSPGGRVREEYLTSPHAKPWRPGSGAGGR